MVSDQSARLVVVLGGARSGKSRYAEQWAHDAAADNRPVVYLATAEAGDEEMATRIEVHRERRPDQWTTIEAPRDLAAALVDHDVAAGSVVLLDCVTLFVSNIVTAEPTPDDDRVEEEIFRDLGRLLEVGDSRALTLIVVSNEVGSGIVPMHPVSRLYRDLVGRANQWLAARADETYLVVAGYALNVSALGEHVR